MKTATRPIIATFLSVALLIPSAALATPDTESARIAELEQRLAALESRLAPAPHPKPSSFGVRAASALNAIRHPFFGAFGLPLHPATISGGGFTGGTVSGATTFSDDVTFNGGTGALGFGTGETLVPADGTLNVTGGITATARVTGDDVYIVDDLYFQGANLAIRDASDNLLGLYVDDGTTGYVQTNSTKQTGTITLSGGTGTATVRSSAVCVCTDTTANASVQCAVATTTLTATGTGSDVIAYWCN